MPRTSLGLGTDEEGETAEVGEPPEGDEEASGRCLHIACATRLVRFAV